jgi:hypothetical protein
MHLVTLKCRKGAPLPSLPHPYLPASQIVCINIFVELCPRRRTQTLPVMRGMAFMAYGERLSTICSFGATMVTVGSMVEVSYIRRQLSRRANPLLKINIVLVSTVFNKRQKT